MGPQSPQTEASSSPITELPVSASSIAIKANGKLKQDGTLMGQYEKKHELGWRCETKCPNVLMHRCSTGPSLDFILHGTVIFSGNPSSEL